MPDNGSDDGAGDGGVKRGKVARQDAVRDVVIRAKESQGWLIFFRCQFFSIPAPRIPGKSSPVFGTVFRAHFLTPRLVKV